MPRQAITNQQKIALREQHRKQPLTTQAQLAHWFNETYYHRPTQSTLSAILSPKYRHLDTDPTEHTINAKRCRTAVPYCGAVLRSGQTSKPHSYIRSFSHKRRSQ
ncbi:hypothetical protein N7471_010276 [Penicillium samsonianum]|uniref:uncharacterized protein n=1 Tax=Penicillium samsonianum TaxID=1882272 RepID=UPI002549A165|nr:uncharacterized protein N7471_010276 [Penicillium samsonianum]KAJ6125783.1 hypothetical protein N7471_010276 [Penicillium samsonianum]